MLRNRSLVLLLSVGALCAGCSWLPWADKTSKPDEPAQLTKYKPEVKIEQLWSAKIGKGLGKKYLRLPPAVIADRIFATDAYGLVEAHERFKGKRIWRASIEKKSKRNDQTFVAGGVGAGEGLVLLGDTRAQAIALSAVDGSERWHVQLTSEVLAAPVTGAGAVYLQTSDGRLSALDAVDGHRLWTYDTQVPPLTLRGTGAPTYAGGLVFAGFANGKVGAYRGATGEPVWEQRVMLPQGRSDLERIVDVDGDLLVTGGAVFAASYQGHLVALRPTDGTVLWERDTSTYLDLAEGYGNVYVVDDKSVVTAVDQHSSDIAWQQRALFKRDLTAAATTGNYLIVGDGDGYLHILAQSDGRLLGRKKIDGDGIRSRPIVADDIVYVLGNSGKLVALKISALR